MVSGVAMAQTPSGTLTREQLDPTRIGVPETGPGSDAGATSVAPPEPQAAPEAPDGFKFRLEGIIVEQATVFDADELLAAYEEFVGTEIGIGQLREIGDRIEKLYREDGYIAARVVVPPQTIENGMPRLVVYEGRIVHYEINGDVGPVKALIASYLENLITDRPAHFSELERYLLLARDIPGISLTATLRPAGDSSPGGVILVVDTALKQFDGFVSAANMSSEPTGPYTFSVGAAMNAQTAYGERTGAVLVFDPEFKEQLTAYLSEEVRLSDEGFVLRFSASQSLSDPGDFLKTLNIRNFATIFTLEGEFPIVRSREFNWHVYGGFNYADVRSDVSRSQILDDQLRTFYSGMRVLWRPPAIDATISAQVEGRLGLDQFGASPRSTGGTFGAIRSRGDGVSDYALLRGELSYTQPVGPFFTVFLRATGQHSATPLFSYEEIVLGNLTVGRGYDPGALTGDSGFGIQAELRYGHPAIQNQWIEDVEFFGFYDWGRVYDRNNVISEFEELSSWGLGLRFRALETILSEFYVAMPLEPALSTASEAPDPSVRFRVTKFF